MTAITITSLDILKEIAVFPTAEVLIPSRNGEGTFLFYVRGLSAGEMSDYLKKSPQTILERQGDIEREYAADSSIVDMFGPVAHGLCTDASAETLLVGNPKGNHAEALLKKMPAYIIIKLFREIMKLSSFKDDVDDTVEGNENGS